MNSAIKPYAEKVYTFDTLTADTNQTAFTLPKLHEYNFYLTVTTFTGTASSMDVALQITPDSGTTWLTVARFAPINSSDANQLNQRMRLKPIMGESELGGVEATDILGGAMAFNVPFPGTTARFHVEETGTVTDFDGTIWLIGNVVEGAHGC